MGWYIVVRGFDNTRWVYIDRMFGHGTMIRHPFVCAPPHFVRFVVELEVVVVGVVVVVVVMMMVVVLIFVVNGCIATIPSSRVVWRRGVNRRADPG